MAHLLSKIRVRLSYRLPKKTMRAVRPFLTVQFVIFMLMGIINTAVSVVTATGLDILNAYLLPDESALASFISHTRLNFIIGYAVSLITSFFLNSKFTFHQKPNWKSFLKFPVSYLPNFVFQYLLVFIFTILRWRTTIAYICAAVLGTPITFIAMKLIVFRRRKKK